MKDHVDLSNRSWLRLMVNRLMLAFIEYSSLMKRKKVRRGKGTEGKSVSSRVRQNTRLK